MPRKKGNKGEPKKDIEDIKDYINGFAVDLSLQQREEFPFDTLAQHKLITAVDISTNRIQRLPDNFGELNHLVRINLSNNSLTSLPDSIGDLEYLKHLALRHNKIKELPLSLGQVKLQTLDLYDNPINHDKLPEKVVGLCVSQKDMKDCARNVTEHLRIAVAKIEKKEAAKKRKEERLALEAFKAEEEEKARKKKEKAEAKRRRKMEGNNNNNNNMNVQENSGGEGDVDTTQQISKDSKKGGSICSILFVLVFVLATALGTAVYLGEIDIEPILNELGKLMAK
eukprot:m.24966 g.24966  ORF g.24966 m.24966 type:complete len:283 (+) comp7660_c0_seq1:123-971(+)